MPIRPSAAPARLRPAARVRHVRYAVRDVVVLADRLRREGRRMLDLNIGDPNPFGFRPPEAMVEAVARAMRENRNGYAPSDGVEEALDSIRRDAGSRGIGSIVHTWIGSGCSEVIEMALSALVDPGENVLVPSPGYPLYTALLAKLEAEARPYFLDESAGWAPDPSDIAARIDARTRAIVVINPNNPTGSVADAATLRRVVDLAVEHDLVVFADEIYDRQIFGGAAHVPLGSLRPDATVLTLNGLSKNWIVPGWRIGWGILTGVAERLADYVEAIRQLGRARLSANHPEQAAIPVALAGPQDHLVAMNRELAARAALATRLLDEVGGLSCVAPRGAFYAFPRLHLDVPDDVFCRELMMETGVVVVPGSGFGQRPGTRHFRVVLLPPPDVLEEACRAIARFVAART
jgi:alanine-synthesizing transaminase